MKRKMIALLMCLLLCGSAMAQGLPDGQMIDPFSALTDAKASSCHASSI